MENKIYEDILSNIVNNDIRIVGFIGPIGAGKSYQAEYLSQLLKQVGKIPIQYSFASKLKEIILQIYGKSKVINFVNKDCYFAEGIAEKYFGDNLLKDLEELKCEDVRVILQKLGTDIMRNKINNNIHIDYFLDFYYCLNKKQNWIILIDDVRFDNEIKTIKNIGGIIIYVNRDKKNILKSLNISEEEYENISNHDSEKEWKIYADKEKYNFEIKINE